jgi:MraZ protein
VSIFKGEYEHALDAKGRVAFPAKLRKYINPAVQDRFTLVKGLEQCLYLYPEDKWLEVEEKLNQISSFSSEGRMVKRQFLRYAEDISLDNQNRIGLSPKMIELAAMDAKVTFIGAGDRVELWAPEVLDSQTNNVSDEDMQALFEKVLGGISL